MKEERFFYPGAESKEPTEPSASNSNHASSIYGSMHGGIPTLESERPDHNVENTDFLGFDNTEHGMEKIDFASAKRRPNAEVLSKEIDIQTKSVIEKNFEKYLEIWKTSEKLNVPVREIELDIYDGLYGHVSNPSQTDLPRTFTPKRISEIFFEVLNEQE